MQSVSLHALPLSGHHRIRTPLGVASPFQPLQSVHGMVAVAGAWPEPTMISPRTIIRSTAVSNMPETTASITSPARGTPSTVMIQKPTRCMNSTVAFATCHPQWTEMRTRLLDHSMDDVRTLVDQKHNQLLAHWYRLVEIWERDWARLKEDNPDVASFVADLDVQAPLNPCEVFYGGRTNAIQLHHQTVGDEEIHYNDYTRSTRGSISMAHIRPVIPPSSTSPKPPTCCHTSVWPNVQTCHQPTTFIHSCPIFMKKNSRSIMQFLREGKHVQTVDGEDHRM